MTTEEARTLTRDEIDRQTKGFAKRVEVRELSKIDQPCERSSSSVRRTIPCSFSHCSWLTEVATWGRVGKLDGWSKGVILRSG